MAPHVSYSPVDGGRGFWPQTASIDWCESNYELSHFIAEFWNTLSNLAFILPQIWQYSALCKDRNVEQVYKSAFLSLALVGIGSFCFHMTLAKSMQMFDETSMILVSLQGFYLLYIIKQPDVNRKKLASTLVCYGLVFLSLYIFLVSWPIFHHTTFILLVYASIAIGYQLKCRYGPHYKFWTVLIMQHLAFAFWLIDKHHCEVLTQFRDHYVPPLLRPFFQFHAIWHLLMGLSSHIFICGIIRLHAWTKHRDSFVIRYKWLGLWIVLEKVDPVKSPSEYKEQMRKLNDYKKTKPTASVDTRSDEASEQLDLNQNQVQIHGEGSKKYL